MKSPTRRFRTDDKGSAILEFTGFLPILLLIGMAVIQLGMVGYAFEQAATAARAAARAESLEPYTGEAAAVAAVSEFFEVDTAAGGCPGDLAEATVIVDIPLLVPFADADWQAVRSVTMPCDQAG
jgi:Flp pilus assembly protein TadG